MVLIMQSLLGEAALSYPQAHSHGSKPAYYSFMRREIMHSKHASGVQHPIAPELELLGIFQEYTDHGSLRGLQSNHTL